MTTTLTHETKLKAVIEWECNSASPTEASVFQIGVLLSNPEAGWYRAKLEFSALLVSGDAEDCGFEGYVSATFNGQEYDGELCGICVLRPKLEQQANERRAIAEAVFPVDAGTDIRWKIIKDTGNPNVKGLLLVELERIG